MPILGLLASQLNSGPGGTPPSAPKEDENTTPHHHPALLSLLAEELSVKSEEIHDFEL